MQTQVTRPEEWGYFYVKNQVKFTNQISVFGDRVHHFFHIVIFLIFCLGDQAEVLLLRVDSINALKIRYALKVASNRYPIVYSVTVF